MEPLRSRVFGFTHPLSLLPSFPLPKRLLFLYCQFKSLDTNGSGTVTVEAIQRGLGKLGTYSDINFLLRRVRSLPNNGHVFAYGNFRLLGVDFVPLPRCFPENVALALSLLSYFLYTLFFSVLFLMIIIYFGIYMCLFLVFTAVQADMEKSKEITLEGFIDTVQDYSTKYDATSCSID